MKPSTITDPAPNMKTQVLVTGLPAKVVEGFAMYVADIHQTKYMVKVGHKQQIQIFFEREIPFNAVFGIKHALRMMGAESALQSCFF